MNKPAKSWFCYLPPAPGAQDWGLHVLDAGYTLIPPGSPYPPQKHPDDHMFSWEEGRVLESFTLVYITCGGGRFESERGGSHAIRSGDLFILFPGERHRYRPDPQTGWDEYWVEFDGEWAKRIMTRTGFSPNKPVVTAGDDSEILRLFIEINEATQSQPPGFEPLIATQTAQIIARTLAHLRHGTPVERETEHFVRQARMYLLQNAERPIDFEALARSLGVSYSVFRRRFRERTGLPPGQYQIQIRLKKARLLLRNSTLSVAEIAERTGFESAQHFTRLFKKKTGRPPAAFRRQSRV